MPQTLRIHPAVAVGDGLKSNVINSRQAGGGAICQERQFAAITLGEVTLGQADLLLDQIEIVVQPLARGG